jgi:hypothetical protein
MANYFNLTLDTLGPAGISLTLNSGATYATTQLINAVLTTTDGNTSGYQMKIWGDIDLTWAKSNGIVSESATEVTEATAQWMSLESPKQIKLSGTDGAKTVNAKLRDDVYNESAQTSASITLDTTRPIVTITGPDVTKISKMSGKNEASFTFSVDSAFTEYKVKVVAASGADESTGAQIGTANGSSNMSATGTFAASTPITSKINGADLEAASSGDGTKIVKIFVKDTAGNWSV